MTCVRDGYVDRLGGKPRSDFPSFVFGATSSSHGDNRRKRVLCLALWSYLVLSVSVTESRVKDQVVEPALLHTGPVPAAVHQRGPGGGLQDSQRQDVSDRRSQSRIEQKKMGKRSNETTQEAPRRRG